MRIITCVNPKLFANLLVVLIEKFPCRGTRFLDHRSCLEKHKVLQTLWRARDHFTLCGGWRFVWQTFLRCRRAMHVKHDSFSVLCSACDKPNPGKNFSKPMRASLKTSFWTSLGCRFCQQSWEAILLRLAKGEQWQRDSCPNVTQMCLAFSEKAETWLHRTSQRHSQAFLFFILCSLRRALQNLLACNSVARHWFWGLQASRYFGPSRVGS